MNELTQGTPGEPSAQVRARVLAARERQLARSARGRVNARLTASELKRLAPLNKVSKTLLERSAEQFGFSARAYHRIIRVARTIADLAAVESITVDHLAEALQYRFIE